MTEIKKHAEVLEELRNRKISVGTINIPSEGEKSTEASKRHKDFVSYDKEKEALDYFIALASKLDRERLVGIIQEWLGCESKEKVNHYICDEYRNVRELANAIIESVVNK